MPGSTVRPAGRPGPTPRRPERLPGPAKARLPAGSHVRPGPHVRPDSPTGSERAAGPPGLPRWPVADRAAATPEAPTNPAAWAVPPRRPQTFRCGRSRRMEPAASTRPSEPMEPAGSMVPIPRPLRQPAASGEREVPTAASRTPEEREVPAAASPKPGARELPAASPKQVEPVEREVSGRLGVPIPKPFRGPGEVPPAPGRADPPPARCRAGAHWPYRTPGARPPSGRVANSPRLPGQAGSEAAGRAKAVPGDATLPSNPSVNLHSPPAPPPSRQMALGDTTSVRTLSGARIKLEWDDTPPAHAA